MEPHLETERIAAYLEGQMEPSARQAFEAELAQRPSLAEAVQRHQRAHRHLDHALALRWKKQMQSWQPVAATPRKRFPWYGWMLLAAAMIAGILWVNFWPQSSYSLFQSYYQTPVLSMPRSDADAAWLEAARAYQSADFERAQQALEALLLQASPDEIPKTTYYLGICYLESGQPQKALQQFQAVSPLSSYQQDAQWAMALTCLALDERLQARQILQEIATAPGHYRQQQARELMGDLGRW